MLFWFRTLRINKWPLTPILNWRKTQLFGNLLLFYFALLVLVFSNCNNCRLMISFDLIMLHSCFFLKMLANSCFGPDYFVYFIHEFCFQVLDYSLGSHEIVFNPFQIRSSRSMVCLVSFQQLYFLVEVVSCVIIFCFMDTKSSLWHISIF